MITFDHEHVPTGLLRRSESAGVAVRPGPAALVHAQDKAIMRDRLTALGAPCPINRVVADAAALIAFGDEQGWPVIAKTSRGGYDGKGVWKLDSAAQASEPFRAAERRGTDHRRGVRGLRARAQCPRGALAVGPGGGVPDLGIRAAQRHLCRDDHTGAGADDDQAVAAQQLALRIAHELGVVGVLAVELMQRPDGVRRGQRARDAAAQHRALDDRRRRTRRSSRTTCGPCSICRSATRPALAQLDGDGQCASAGHR